MAELVTREEASGLATAAESLRWEGFRRLPETILHLYDRIGELEGAMLKHGNLDLRVMVGYDAGKQESAARIAELEGENKRLREFAKRYSVLRCTCTNSMQGLLGAQCESCKARAALKGTQG